MGQSEASKQRVQGEAAREKALALRRAGASYSEIGRAMGISKKNAMKHVTKALAKLKKENTEAAEQVRDLELQRLDEMQKALYAAALAPETVVKGHNRETGKPIAEPDRDRQLRVMDRIIKLMERRAALLGIDAPKRLEQSGPNGGPIPTRDESRADLKRLTLAELEAYEKLAAKAEGRADPEPGQPAE